MLQEIHIQNYAVIDDLTLEFHPGLNLLSGETGSGKSIVVDALGLALGGRATMDVIRTGCDAATVSAVFELPAGADWSRSLEEYGLEISGEAGIIFRRVIQSSGRSRLLVNDQPVTLAAASALAGRLVEIHGQSEQMSLFSRSAQLELLDRFAGVGGLLERVGEIYTRRHQLENEIESLSQNEQDRLRTIDLLSFQVRELEQAHLEPGEDGKLEEEKRILVHMEKIQTATSTAYGALYEDDQSACERVGIALRALEELQRYDASLENHLNPLRETKAQLEDLAFVVRDHVKNLEASPHRLEEVEDRLVLIDRLKRKYGKSVEEVIAYCERMRQQLAGLEHSDERREELAGELKRVAGEYKKIAEQLSAKRREAAERLEKLVRKELADLSMEKTLFAVHFEPDAARSRETSEGGPRGLDSIEFRISPNPGEELRPLDKIASGGELSRIMLALKTVLGSGQRADGVRAQKSSTPAFVFDEVDTGIGGRVAERVGQRLKRLARHVQVVCVTHLAQIACFADHHFYVEKFERNGRTLTRVKALASDNERAGELARMLSGSQVTDAILEHAAAMLKQASA